MIFLEQNGNLRRLPVVFWTKSQPVSVKLADIRIILGDGKHSPKEECRESGRKPGRYWEDLPKKGPRMQSMCECWFVDCRLNWNIFCFVLIRTSVPWSRRLNRFGSWMSRIKWSCARSIYFAIFSLYFWIDYVCSGIVQNFWWNSGECRR